MAFVFVVLQNINFLFTRRQ